MNRDRLRATLSRHEGRRLKPYQDTRGHLTIGVGRNLDTGLRESEVDFMLDNDIDSCIKALSAVLPCFAALDDVRAEVLVNMVFNQGITGFMRNNPKMIAALEAKDYPTAAKEMLDGPWKDQVKGRAYELAAAMESGKF